MVVVPISTDTWSSSFRRLRAGSGSSSLKLTHSTAERRALNSTQITEESQDKGGFAPDQEQKMRKLGMGLIKSIR